MLNGLNVLGIGDFDLDDFSQCNQELFDYQENYYAIHQKYRLISLVCMALIDLGLVEFEE